MKKLRLRKEVIITGRDFFGRKAWIKFIPSEDPGWFWRPRAGETPIPITADIVRRGKNHLTLFSRKKTLHIYEHIGVLRFLGIDGVIIEATAWPPYHGRPLELWNAVKECCTKSDEDFLWYTPEKDIGWRYPNAEPPRYTFIRPLKTPGLRIEILVEYPEIGSKKLLVNIPQNATVLLRAFEVYSQGWPRWRYYASRAASFAGWPHHHKTIWPQKHVPTQTIKFFALHRLVDLLGGLSTISNTKLIAGIVLSERSGHEADIRVAQSIKLK